MRDSSQNLADDVAVDVGQAVVPALEAEGETGVVESQAVQQGGLQIVDMDFVTDDAEAQVVRSTVDIASLDSTSTQDQRETIRVMVPAKQCALRGTSFPEGRSAKFTTPDD
jgi:hypothetical protein